VACAWADGKMDIAIRPKISEVVWFFITNLGA
jgi:hypothetical protein